MSEEDFNVRYIGDGVYAYFDGYQIWLKVNDRQFCEIALEPQVYDNLTDYIHDLETKYNFKFASK